MDEVRVETGVDDLMAYLRSNGKVSLKEVSSNLKIPESTLQLWLDFLVEEKIIGMEYKFTKPYIFLNQDFEEKKKTEADISEEITIDTFKKEFFDNAKKNKLPESKIPALWENHIIGDIDKQKDFFIEEAKKRSLENPDQLFKQYKQRLLGM